MSSGFRLRVKATQLAVRRVDGTEEDDFKTWAHTVVAGTSGPVKEAWYAEDAEPSVSNLGKTSVRAWGSWEGLRGGSGWAFGHISQGASWRRLYSMGWCLRTVYECGPTGRPPWLHKWPAVD
jgi:hypothetical protein